MSSELDQFFAKKVKTKKKGADDITRLAKKLERTALNAKTEALDEDGDEFANNNVGSGGIVAGMTAIGDKAEIVLEGKEPDDEWIDYKPTDSAVLKDLGVKELESSDLSEDDESENGDFQSGRKTWAVIGEDAKKGSADSSDNEGVDKKAQEEAAEKKKAEEEAAALPPPEESGGKFIPSAKRRAMITGGGSDSAASRRPQQPVNINNVELFPSLGDAQKLEEQKEELERKQKADLARKMKAAEERTKNAWAKKKEIDEKEAEKKQQEAEKKSNSYVPPHLRNRT